MHIELPEALCRPNPRAPTEPRRIDAVALDARGEHVAIGARGRVLVYRLRDRALVEQYRTAGEAAPRPAGPDEEPWAATEVCDVRFAPGGRHLVVVFAVYENNNDTYTYVEVFDRSTGVRLYVLFPESEADSGADLPRGCTSVAVSPDGAVLAAASVEFGVGLWDLATGRRLDGPLGARELPALQGELRFTADLAFSPDGRRLLIATYDRGHLLEYALAERRCADLGVVPGSPSAHAGLDMQSARLKVSPDGASALLVSTRGSRLLPLRAPWRSGLIKPPDGRCVPVHIAGDTRSVLWATVVRGQAGALLRQAIPRGTARALRRRPPLREAPAARSSVRDDLVRDFPAAISADGARVARVDGARLVISRVRQAPRRA